jgi:hypothetical protein
VGSTVKFQELDSRKIFWLLFTLCIGIRVYLFFCTYVIARDSAQYMGMAELFLTGRFLTAFEYITPPFYPLLLAGMKLVISDPEIAGKLVSLLLGTCAFFPLYYLGKRFFEQKVVFVGLFLFAIHPYLVRYSAEVLSESTFIFLSITGFWLLWKGWEERRYLFCALAGFILALSCLTRAQGFIWLGTIVTVPFVFSLIRREKEKDRRTLWVSFLVAAFAFLLVILPYSCFLKSITGEWTIRQDGGYSILMGTGYSQKQGLWVALGTLLSHPLYLVNKLGLNMGTLFLLLPETIHYPFIVLLVIGLLAWKHTKRHLQGELYLAVICLVYVLGHCFLYLKVRYLLSIVPFALFWVGQGFWVIVSWVQKFCARYNFPRLMEPHRALFVTAFLICLTASSALPKTLLPQRLDKLDRKEIGNRIAALFSEHPLVLATDPRIEFYSQGHLLDRRKRTIGTFAELLEYAHAHNVDIIVMDIKELHDEGRYGDLTRDFFAHADHPDLELLFVYPIEDETSSPRFYVYRLIAEGKQPEGTP